MELFLSELRKFQPLALASFLATLAASIQNLKSYNKRVILNPLTSTFQILEAGLCCINNQLATGNWQLERGTTLSCCFVLLLSSQKKSHEHSNKWLVCLQTLEHHQQIISARFH